MSLRPVLDWIESVCTAAAVSAPFATSTAAPPAPTGTGTGTATAANATTHGHRSGGSGKGSGSGGGVLKWEQQKSLHTDGWALLPVVWRDTILLCATGRSGLREPLTVEMYWPSHNASAVLSTTTEGGAPSEHERTSWHAVLIRNETAVLLIGGGLHAAPISGVVIDLSLWFARR